MRLTKYHEYWLLWGAICIGIILRFTNVTSPDIATDEAQFALGASAAWTPLGMQIVTLIESLFGYEIIVARGASILFGIAALPVMYFIAIEVLPTQEDATKQHNAVLYVCALAALFTSHILYSKLAYPSIYMCFWLLVLLLSILKLRHNAQDARWLLLLFAATICASMTKSQGFLFPGAFILGHIAVHRLRVRRDPVFWTLCIGLIPVGWYLITHPGVLATVFFYGGNAYGVSGFLYRAVSLLSTWWTSMPFFFLAGIASIVAWRTMPWQLNTFTIVAVMIGFLLGPSHAYYSTHLITLALPCAYACTRLPLRERSGIVIACAMVSVIIMGPWHSSFTHPIYRAQAYWNANETLFHELLQDEERVTVLGYAGHHVRWYIKPQLLVGKDMTPPYPTDIVIVFKDVLGFSVAGDVLYEDDILQIVRQYPSE